MSVGIHHLLLHFPVALWSLAAALMLWRAWRADAVPVWCRSALTPLLLVGLLGGIAASVSGVFAWAPEAVLASPMARNKLTLALWTLAWWGMLWWLHHRFGGHLYRVLPRWAAMALVAVGMAMLAVTGSLGGALAGVSAGGPDLLRWLGFELHTTLRVPWWSFVALSVIMLGMLLAARRTD